MKKALIAIIALGLMAGCTATVNNRDTGIYLNAGTSMRIDAPGATHSTTTDQKADGDFSGAIEAAKAWIEGNIGKVVESLQKGEDIVIPVVPVDKEETFEPAAVSPAGQGEFEEVE